MRTSVVVQHHPSETLGSNFRSILSECGSDIVTVPAYEWLPESGEFHAPDLDEVDAIVTLGGPMSANDPYPALKGEMSYSATCGGGRKTGTRGLLGSAASRPGSRRHGSSDGGIPVRPQKAVGLAGGPLRSGLRKDLHTAGADASRGVIHHTSGSREAG